MKKFLIISTILLCAGLISCSKTIEPGAGVPQIVNGVNTILADEGGTVTYNSEVKLTVPENSLPANADIAIAPTTEIPAGGADGLQPFGQAYKFTPAGTSFDLSNPALVEIEYDKIKLAEKCFSNDTVSLYYYDEEIGSYVAVASYIDKTSGKIIAQVEHFTTYVPMAKAKLATNNAPIVALQNTVPNPLRTDTPIYVRATVTDIDGSLAGVRVYYRKLQPSAGVLQSAVMTREIRPNTLNTYVYTIPANFLTSIDLGIGNDIEFYVQATDNLGAVIVSTTRRLNVTRRYSAGTLTITPASLSIASGFENYFILRGRDTGGTTFQMIPETYTLQSAKGSLKNHGAGGILFHANASTATGVPEKLTLTAGAEFVSSNITIYAGEIKSIEILDTTSNSFVGQLLLAAGAIYEFDAVGIDENGNKMPINPSWSADSGIGTVDNAGKFTASGIGTGKVYIDLGEFHAEQQVLVLNRVTSTSPANNALNVSATALIQITFAENVNSGTVDDSTIVIKRLVGADEYSVGGSFSTSGNVVTFTPSSNLMFDANYRVQVTGNVKSSDSNPVTPYTFNFHVANNNADLANLTASQGNIGAFDPTLTTYSGKVVSSVSSITVTPTAYDPDATVTVNGTAVTSGTASGIINLNAGSNTITIAVTAENSITKTYTINITRVLPGTFVNYNWMNTHSSSDIYSFVTRVYVSGSNIYAATPVGLLISTDGGTTWVNKTTANGLISINIRGVYASGSIIYAATNDGLSISTDGGTTWVNKTTANGLGNNVVSGVYASGSTIYAATNFGLSISTDGGATWVNKTTANGLGGNNIQGVYASGSTIYAATNFGLSISTDGGTTWVNKTTANGLGSNFLFGVYVSGSNVYVATNGGGLSISSDGGITWVNKTTTNGLSENIIREVYASGSTICAATASGLSISTDGGTTWVNKTTANGLNDNYILGVYVSGSNVYAATFSGLSISTDGGATWVNKSTANGLGSNNIYDVYASGSTIYTATHGGLSISNDGGATWVNKTTTNGLGNNIVGGVYVSGSTIYAATNWGLSISTDGGITWVNKTTANGLGGNNIYDVHASGSTIYAATNFGLSISTDGGTTWVNKTNGLGSHYIWGVYASGLNIYAATDGGLSISTDGGITWINKTTANGLGRNNISGVYASGSTIYAATIGGLSISTDGGTTWVNKTTTNGLGNNFVRGVYTSGSTIYAATDGGGLSISIDGGTTWINKTITNGLGDNIIFRVYASGSTVYAATNKGLSILQD